MRYLGATLQEIADKHYSGHRSNAHRAIARAIARTRADTVDELRGVMNGRLELMWKSNVRGVLKGETGPSATALRVLDRQAKLNGLDVNPQTEGGGTGTVTVIFDPAMQPSAMAEVEVEVDPIDD